MAIIALAPAITQGLLSTAIRTAGSRAIQPYVTNLVSQGMGRKSATTVAKQYVKTVDKANKTGSLPLIDKTANLNISRALNNTQRTELQRKGLLASDEVTQNLTLLKELPKNQQILSKARMLGTQTSPAVNVNPNLFNTLRPNFILKGQPFTPKVDSSRLLPFIPKQTVSTPTRKILRGSSTDTQQRLFGGGTAAGLLGAGALSFLADDTVTPKPTIAPTQVEETSQDSPLRFSEILKPSAKSTAKEVLNAALLRAGVTLLKGGDTDDVIKSVGSLSESQNVFRTGKEALEAGKQQLGEDASISVRQKSDGTYTYSGSIDPTAAVLSSLFQGQSVDAIPKGKITKAQRDALAEIIRQQQPQATEEDITDTLEAQGYIYP